jgi:hypothetical protein
MRTVTGEEVATQADKHDPIELLRDGDGASMVWDRI